MLNTVKKENIEEATRRFHSYYIKNKKSKCWEWQKYLDKDGYGFISVYLEDIGKGQRREMNRKVTRAHRFSFFIANNTLPELVMHTCDNPRCVNPKHLKAGTDYLNSLDKCKKGRQYSKHTEETIQEIRKLYESGKHTQAELCRKYNINCSCMHKIVKRKQWKHVI